MQLPTIPKIGRLSRKHKITAAGVAGAAAVALTVTGLVATSGGSAVATGDPTGFSVSTGDQVKNVGPQSGLASQKAIKGQADAAKKKAADAVAAKKAAAEAAAKKKAATEAAAKKKSAAQAAERSREAANRSTKRVVIQHTAPVAAQKAAPVKKAAPVQTAAPVKKVATVTYTNNLDGWIRQARSILAAHNIPVPTYNGIYRNAIRESSGNPNAINLWDSNAAKGIPSKGLLQTIDSTFDTYHVSGTSWNIYNPVANIAAACNYAYHVYGGMDNVYSAY